MQIAPASSDHLVTACHTCAQNGPTKLVAFRQNIGIVVMRFGSKVEGRFCKSCLRSHFYRTTLVTFVFGFWGIASFFVSLYILPSNALTMLRAASLPEPHPRALGWGIVLSLLALGSVFFLSGVLVTALSLATSAEHDWNDLGVSLFFVALAVVLGVLPGAILWILAIAGRLRSSR